MKLTIIPDDGAVYCDTISYFNLDMSGVPTDVHALQWKETSGWVEFTESPDGVKAANTLITELPEWARDLVLAWDSAKASALEAK